MMLAEMKGEGIHESLLTAISCWEITRETV